MRTALVLPIYLLLGSVSVNAGTLGGVQVHVEGNVSLADLSGGPAITDSFSLDGPPSSLPLSGDAFADSIIPSTATVQAVAETDALAVASETANLSGVESASTSATATLTGTVGEGQWLLTVTTEHVAQLLGAGLVVDAEIAYNVSSAAGTLVDETLLYSGASDDFGSVVHVLDIAAGDTGTLTASIVVNTASAAFGTALALSVAEFDLTVAIDSDGDGVPDAADNCTQAANPAQRDTDGDGIGNACDPDLNNDCTVNFQDLMVIRTLFFSNDADADFNGDGLVNFGDLQIMKNSFFGPPGPSGVANDCD